MNKINCTYLTLIRAINIFEYIVKLYALKKSCNFNFNQEWLIHIISIYCISLFSLIGFKDKKLNQI